MTARGARRRQEATSKAKVGATAISVFAVAFFSVIPEGDLLLPFFVL
jgi:hypothetical protein